MRVVLESVHEQSGGPLMAVVLLLFQLIAFDLVLLVRFLNSVHFHQIFLSCS